MSEATKVVRALRAAHLHDDGRQALLRMACERIRSWGPPYTSVYAYMLYGNARITAVDANGRNFIDDVGVGDLWYFPAGIPHSIQGLNPD